MRWVDNRTKAGPHTNPVLSAVPHPKECDRTKVASNSGFYFSAVLYPKRDEVVTRRFDRTKVAPSTQRHCSEAGKRSTIIRKTYLK